MQRENLPAYREGRFDKYVDYSRSATIVHKAQKSLDRLGLRDSIEIVCSMTSNQARQDCREQLRFGLDCTSHNLQGLICCSM